MKIPNVWQAATGTPWAVDEQKLRAAMGVLWLKMQGGRLSAEEIRAAIGDGPGGAARASSGGGIAVIPIQGLILPRATPMEESSGVMSLQRIGVWFDAAMRDETVSTIVLDIDSPGGQVSGVAEFAAKVLAAREEKKIVAVANHLCASAAYWIAACASEVVASPSALVGSIGTMLVHCDESKHNAEEGLTYTVMSAGKYKAEGNPMEPLTDEARAATEQLLGEFYEMFVGAVAKGRGVKASEVRAGFGQGRCLSAQPAKAEGLVDRVESMESVLARLGGRGGRRGGARALAPDLGTTDLEPLVAAATTRTVTASRRGAITLDVKVDTTEMEVLVARMEAASPHTHGRTEPGNGDVAPQAAPVPEHAPAAEAKEHTMETPSTAAPANGGEVAALQAKLARIEGFNALRRGYPDMAAQIDKLETEGATVETAKDKLLALYRERHSAAPAAPAPDARIRVDLPNEARAPWGGALWGDTLAQVRAGGLKRSDPRYINARNQAFGEQLQAIARQGMGQGTDPRLLASVASGGAQAGLGADGGFLIQKEFAVDLLESTFAGGELLSRVDAHEVGANADGLEVIYLDETSRATGSRWGGVQVYRGAEADSATAKKPKLGKWESRLEDIIGLAYATERLLQDAPSIAQVFSNGFAAEFQFVVEDEIFRGTGAGQCLGYTTTGGPAVSVAKETGQTADTIVYENVKKMWARVHPRSKANGVWFINTACLPQLMDMQVGTGTSGTLVFMPPGGISGLPYATLFGRPVIEIEYAAALGDVGDISFADLSRYKLITKGGLMMDESIHVRFTTNERAFRWITRVNGAPKDKSAITPYKGTDTLSPFVTLAAR